MNSLSFCLSKNVLISFLFLKDSFARYRILGRQFFSFSTLYISSHCILASEVSEEKLHIILLKISCIWWISFLLLLSVSSLYFSNLIIVCLVWVSLGLSYLEFGACLEFEDFYLSSNLGSFLAIFSLIISLPLSSVSGTPIMSILSIWWFTRIPLYAVHFSLFFSLSASQT